MRLKISWLLSIFLLLTSSEARAFQYQSLPDDNLIENPWFRSSNCKYSGEGWNMNDTSLGSEASWGGSDKFQDPNDINCDGNWTGFAARFARNAGKTQEFSPNKNAIMSQVVGPVDEDSTNISFHFLFVAHRFNHLKAEIYGGETANGPWKSVWIPFEEKSCTAKDCANAPYNQFCMKDRVCLWDYVTQAYLGSLSPLQKDLSKGYSYYKVSFLMNYPEPDNTATGDVGGKIARVYFSVDEEGQDSKPQEVPPAQETPSQEQPVSRAPISQSNQASQNAAETNQAILVTVFLALLIITELAGIAYFSFRKGIRNDQTAKNSIMFRILVSLLLVTIYLLISNLLL